MRQSVSIAMAVYNGERYLHEQIDSILVQLKEGDELIISYDESTDRTWEIIKEYEKIDRRVSVFINFDHSKSHVSNFENALKYCKNPIIFYSDQDDVWMNNKIDTICNSFDDARIKVIIHDARLVDKDLNTIEESTFQLRNGNTSLLRNLVRLSYIGCCMAFRREMLKVILPFPEIYTGAHDWWTGSICSCYGEMGIIHETLIWHRMHENNTTCKKRQVIYKLFFIRFGLVKSLFVRKLLVWNIE